ncbi:MAG TPA: Gfo/Idh/MocA family oxidoreductase [Tepidisphaeraceae bacterium]|nr:Gfo/Idh/MocA family oxidoreductase [Tepidisphaeraceae bacterium]
MAINIGILGIAHGHVSIYCDLWKDMQSEVRLAGIWDHDASRAADAAKKFGMPVEPSIASLLGRRDIDAVVIGAETSMHAELVEKAAAAGKHIALQKPLALTLAEADRIVAAVKKSGVRFTLAWQMRVDQQNLQMKQLVQNGTLGRVFMLRRRHGLSTHTWANFENSWHAQPELNRGMWADDASHAIDFIYWMLGEPATVSAEIATLHNPKVPDDNGIAIFRYADGTFAEVASSFTCLAGENTTEIVGEKGVVIQNFGDLVSCSRRTGDAVGLKWMLREGPNADKWINSEIASPPNHQVRLRALAKPLLEFLEGRRPPIATAEEGRTALRMTLACYASAEQGRRVRVEDVH